MASCSQHTGKEQSTKHVTMVAKPQQGCHIGESIAGFQKSGEF